MQRVELTYHFQTGRWPSMHQLRQIYGDGWKDLADSLHAATSHRLLKYDKHVLSMFKGEYNSNSTALFIEPVPDDVPNRAVDNVSIRVQLSSRRSSLAHLQCPMVH